MNIKETEAWSEKYQLPTFNSMNPHLFVAYVAQLIAQSEEPFTTIDIYTQYSNFLASCEVMGGLYKRYPDGSSGLTSWDEIIGIARIRPSSAKDIYNYLEVTDGIYDSENENSTDERKNVYRLPFIRPLLRLAAGMRVSLIDQAILCGWMIWDAVNPDQGMSGHLQLWLYLPLMKEKAVTSIGAAFWQWRMKARGISTYHMFTEYFHNEPKFKEWLVGALEGKQT